MESKVRIKIIEQKLNMKFRRNGATNMENNCLVIEHIDALFHANTF